MKRDRSLWIVLGLGSLMLATTFVIKEGGREVGRWEEQDGKNEVQVIENDTPKPAPSKYAIKEYSDEGGYAAEFQKTAATNLATWTFSGRLIDWLSLTGVPGVEITFTGGPQAVKVKTDGEGYFIAKAPALQGASYGVSCALSPNYDGGCEIFKKIHLSQQPSPSRLRSYSSVQFRDAGEFYLSGDTYEIELGVKRRRLNAQENADLEQIRRADLPPPASDLEDV